MFARFSSPKRAERLRAVGWLILVAGLAGAAAFYVIKRLTVDPALDDRTALGYSRSMQHGMDVMMGQSGRLLTDMQQMLATPAGEALLIALCVALAAGYCFRVAWVLDAEESE